MENPNSSLYEVFYDMSQIQTAPLEANPDLEWVLIAAFVGMILGFAIVFISEAYYG